MKKFLATLVCGLAFAGMASAGSITIQGNGKVTYTPDVGYVHGGVQSRGKTAGEAWEKNGEAVRKIAEALKKLGVDPRDVKTMSLNVNPEYFYPKIWGTTLEPQLIGYIATYDLSVTVRRLDDMGKACDALVENGANQNLGISFGCSDLEKALDQARAKAVADARKQAEIYVTGAGASLGLVQSIQVGHYAPMPQYQLARTMEAAKDHAPLPVFAGEQELTVTVTITWEFVHTAPKVS